MRKLLAIIALLIILLAGAAPPPSPGLRGTACTSRTRATTRTEQFVTIRQGAGSAEIGRRLADAQIVSDDRLFRAALWWTGQDAA